MAQLVGTERSLYGARDEGGSREAGGEVPAVILARGVWGPATPGVVVSCRHSPVWWRAPLPAAEPAKG